jgi:hypothetical protein
MQLGAAARPLRRSLAQQLRHSSAAPAVLFGRRTPPGPAAVLGRCGMGAQSRLPHGAGAGAGAALCRRWCSSSAEEPSPKIKELVDQIASLTLLEAAQLTDALKASRQRAGQATAVAAKPAAAFPRPPPPPSGTRFS